MSQFSTSWKNRRLGEGFHKNLIVKFITAQKGKTRPMHHSVVHRPCPGPLHIADFLFKKNTIGCKKSYFDPTMIYGWQS